MSYFVYLLASKKDGVLYLGVTNDLVRRIHEHKTKAAPGFNSRYNVALLVWFEVYDDPINAIGREKEIKKWRRAWKVALIQTENPGWFDLTIALFDGYFVLINMMRFRVRVRQVPPPPRNDVFCHAGAGSRLREREPGISSSSAISRNDVELFRSG